MRALSRLGVLLVGLLAPFIIADNTFQVGVVYSATGSLTDTWGEAVNGTRMWLRQINDVLGSSGLRITDNAGNSMMFKFNLTVADDASSALGHYNAVKGMLNNNVDFIFNAQPAFAINESMTVDMAKRINMHGFTANDDVFTRDLKGVFGVARAAKVYSADLLNELRVASIFSLAFVYRDDIPELKAICEAAIANAQTYLLKVVATIKYQASDYTTMNNVANQISTTDDVEALFGCGLSVETKQLAQMIDKYRKPLKAMVFTNGPGSLDFLSQVGNIGQYLMTPTPWFQTLSLTDLFYGSASDFAVKYTTLYGTAPTHIAAGTAAAGYVLQQALQAAFTACNISATGGDVQKLLYSTNVISCTDNNNEGRLRLLSVMQTMTYSTFFGDVAFNKYRQNYATSINVLQAFQSISNLKLILAPSVIIPISGATATKKIPQPNRYAPICQPGTYMGTDQFLPCIPCPMGSFQDRAGRTSCELCPKNLYQNSTGQAECVDCPDNSETLVRGAGDVLNCTCKANFWTNERVPGVPCLKCPENSHCAGGVDVPQPNTGWYAEKDNPALMFNCNPNYVCDGSYQCGKGYAGRMCIYCDKGYFMAFTKCWSCPSSPMVNVLAMILMYVLFFLINASVSRSFDIFTVLMNFCQFLSVINSFNVNWPNLLNVLMNYMSVLSFEMDVIQPQCVAPEWSFEENLVVQIVTPIVITVLVAIWTGITYASYRFKIRILGRQAQGSGTMGASMDISNTSMTFGSASVNGSITMEATATSSWWLFLQNVMHIPSDRLEMQELVYQRAALPFMFINISYLALLKYLLAAFYCFDFMGTYYVYYSPNDKCYTPKHYRIMMIATGGLIVYVVGLWALFYHVLRHLKRTRNFGGKKPLLLFGWMYERYKAELYWFEAIQIMQKTIYVIVMVFLLPDPVLQVMICLVLAVGCSMLDVQTNALINRTAHNLQTVTDAALSGMLVLGLIFFNNVVLPRTLDLAYYLGLVILFGALGVLIIFFVVEIVFHILIAVLMARHNRIAKKWGHTSKQYRHVYSLFEPMFMIRWLFKAKPEDWLQWHRLCTMMQHNVHPTNETSYLSIKKVGRFWRYLLENFPEMIDFLATCETEQRENFSAFADVMFELFFDTQEEVPVQLNMVVTDKHKASLAQWLSSADDKEIEFLRNIILSAYGHAKGDFAKEEMARALSRSKSCASVQSMTHKGLSRVSVSSQPGQGFEPSAVSSPFHGQGGIHERRLSGLVAISGANGKNFAEALRKGSVTSPSPYRRPSEVGAPGVSWPASPAMSVATTSDILPRVAAGDTPISPMGPRTRRGSTSRLSFASVDPPSGPEGSSPPRENIKSQDSGNLPRGSSGDWPSLISFKSLKPNALERLTEEAFVAQPPDSPRISSIASAAPPEAVPISPHALYDQPIPNSTSTTTPPRAPPSVGLETLLASKPLTTTTQQLAKATAELLTDKDLASSSSPIPTHAHSPRSPRPQPLSIIAAASTSSRPTSAQTPFSTQPPIKLVGGNPSFAQRSSGDLSLVQRSESALAAAAQPQVPPSRRSARTSHQITGLSPVNAPVKASVDVDDEISVHDTPMVTAMVSVQPETGGSSNDPEITTAVGSRRGVAAMAEELETVMAEMEEGVGGLDAVNQGVIDEEGMVNLDKALELVERDSGSGHRLL